MQMRQFETEGQTVGDPQRKEGATSCYISKYSLAI